MRQRPSSETGRTSLASTTSQWSTGPAAAGNQPVGVGVQRGEAEDGCGSQIETTRQCTVPGVQGGQEAWRSLVPVVWRAEPDEATDGWSAVRGRSSGRAPTECGCRQSRLIKLCPGKVISTTFDTSSPAGLHGHPSPPGLDHVFPGPDSELPGETSNLRGCGQ